MEKEKEEIDDIYFGVKKDKHVIKLKRCFKCSKPIRAENNSGYCSSCHVDYYRANHKAAYLEYQKQYRLKHKKEKIKKLPI